jgi:phage tail-like protein
MDEGGERDAFSAGNFEVQLGSESVGFAEVSGLGLELDYTGDAIVGRVNRVTLRRAVTGDLTLWAWVRRTLDGAFEPWTMTVTLLDSRREPVCVWELRGARPVKWNGPDLNAMGGGEVAMEELVLTAEGLELRSGRADGDGSTGGYTP